LVNENRILPDATITTEKVELYGKPDKYQSDIDKVFTDINTDILDGNFPLIFDLNEFGFNQTDIDRVGENIKTYLNGYKSTYQNNIATIVQELVKNQKDYVQTFRKINLVCDKVDGKLLEGNLPVVYNLSGITSGSTNTLDVLTEDYKKLIPVIKGFNDTTKEQGIIDKTYNDGDYLLDDKVQNTYLQNIYQKRMYLILARVFTDKNKLQQFKNAVITNELKSVKNPSNLSNKFDKVCSNYVKSFEKANDFYEKKFVKFKKTPNYKNLTDGVEDELYPKGKERKINYNTTPDSNVIVNGDKLKKLYLEQPKI
jgi:hypothetical protein